MVFACALPSCGKDVLINGKCSGCKTIHYCSREHQIEHFGQHKNVCKQLARTKTEENMMPVRIVMLPPEMCATVERLEASGQAVTVRDYHEEYKARFPEDVCGFTILSNQRKVEMYANNKIKAAAYGYNCILDNHAGGLVGRILFFDWSIWCPELWKYLKEKEGKLGEVWKNHPRFHSKEQPGYGEVSGADTRYQTMRNTYSQKIQMERGRTYISVGFVDLQQLLEAEVVGCARAGPAVWRGYEMSQIAVGRAKIILRLLEVKAPVDQVLQIWYSSCISEEAALLVQSSCHHLELVEEDPEQKQLFKHWGKSSLGTVEATALWLQHLEGGALALVCGNLTNSTDRVEYARYLLTGKVFLGDGDTLTGNLTWFCLPKEYLGFKKDGENIFHSIDVSCLDYTDTLLQTVEATFTNQLLLLRENIHSGKLSVKLNTNKLAPGMKETFKEIQAMNPAQIDWSNVPDYLGVKDFFIMAKQCSGETTKHSFHLMNWIQTVFGCHLSDYVPYAENYRKLAFGPENHFKDRKGVVKKLVRSLTQDLKLQLAQAPPPLFIQVDVDQVPFVIVSNEVLSQRYLENYMAFLFNNQERVTDVTWKKRPFSIFSRINSLVDVSFVINN